MIAGWDFFFTDLNDARAAVFVDLDLRQRAPDPKRPWRLWLWVELQDPGASGIGGREDAEQLYRIESRLTSIVKRQSATYAGRIRRAGKWEFYVYAKTDKGFADAMHELMANFPEHRFLCGQEEDPGWMFYLNVLYPNHVDIHQIINRKQVEKLQEQGDSLIKARPVEHWLAFPTTEAQARFTRYARSQGYEIKSQSQRDAPSDGRPFVVHLVRRDYVDAHAIDAAVAALVRKADEFEGEYGGWQAPAVTT